ncbi:hypothetical protein PspLS_09292 [Pyricularia sp. CBS 133598]|nr:hypothetical protein PspLS_09292 [Pyricularia sp. CBS 133598]
MVSIRFINLLTVAGLVAATPVADISPRQDTAIACPSWNPAMGIGRSGQYCCWYSSGDKLCCNRWKGKPVVNNYLDCDSKWWATPAGWMAYNSCPGLDPTKCEK